jgi:hypothetical protein
MTTRWIFNDAVASETWTVPVNPDSMTSPEPPAKNVRYARGKIVDQGGDPRTVTFLNKPTSRDWEFGGVIRTQAHYEALAAWADKTNEVTITDHLGRVWLVYITDFIPTDRRPTRQTFWRLRYTMKTKIIERVS